MNRILLCLGISLMLLSLLERPVLAASVATTRHNLSVSGPGPVRAASEQEICIFCHTPHSASPAAPLWNRNASGVSYDTYWSSTIGFIPGQPTGDSLLCLSCHDGTIALGNVISRSSDIAMSGGVTTMPVGSDGLLSTELSDDHPISFEYTSGLDGELVDPATLTGPVQLDASGQLQCTACHDAHDDTYGQFLVMSNLASALCTTCHAKNYWSQAAHKNSTATWNNTPPDPWPTAHAQNTVADNACENCHTPHAAGALDKRLLYHDAEVDNCKACHNGNVTGVDLMAEFSKPYGHPMGPVGDHDPVENVQPGTRHAVCVDCHNPHAASATPTGTVPGPLNDVRGVSQSQAEIRPIGEQYQLCYRCHADSTGKPPAPTTRQIEQTNVRLEFNSGNPSSHPITSIGSNPNVPSLIAPLTENSIITCGDCHNNNASSKTGGAGPEGPHGSIYPSILLRQYVTADNTTESASNYALCYSCHDRNSILNDNSFKEHDKHIRKEDTPCNVCHDPHGISSTQGNSTNNSNLINFDTSVVFPNMHGQLRFEDQGSFRGSCWLRCHGKDHRNKNY